MAQDNKLTSKILLERLLSKYGVKKLANHLNLAVGTIHRWRELDNIPPHYEFDLLRLSNLPIVVSQYNSSQKDQFYTSLENARKCYFSFLAISKISTNEYIFIEPSAGDGSFLNFLPSNTIAMDIEPRANHIITQDYLKWQPHDMSKQYIVIGNPPFGLRGHMALNFINHSYDFADYVVFILPQLFFSDGKGSPRKRVKGYNLIHSEKLSSEYHTPDKHNIMINCVFQIWSKYTENDKLKITVNKNQDIKIYSLSDGGTIASTRNKKMLDCCDIYLPSTCFGSEAMKCYMQFNALPNKKGYGVVFLKNKQMMIERAKKIKWSDVSFLSTNSAYNLRTSLIINALLL